MKATRHSKIAVELLRAPHLGRYPWLGHGFSTRRPNELNLSYSRGSAAAVTQNRRALLESVGRQTPADRWQLLTLRQRHTDLIQVVPRAASPHLALAGQDRSVRERDGALKLLGDALITNQPGLLLAVQVADCLPILLADPRKRVVAAVHAGWRGSVKRIAEKAVGRMQQDFGCNPKTILAAIGPSIHPCCYQVGREVLEAFEGQFPYVEKLVQRVQPSPTEVRWQQPLFSPNSIEAAPVRAAGPHPAITSPAGGGFFLDLVEANRRQLRAAGLKAAHIWVSPFCTACRTDLFFSHRAQQGRTGRMMGLVGRVN